MKTNSLFYRLFQEWPQLALELMQLPYSGESCRFVSEEIKQTGFRIDGLFKPTQADPDLPIIFAEVQYQPDPDFYGRFFSEITLYCYRQKPARAWLALVIYPTRSTETPASIEFKPFMALPQLRRLFLEDYQNLPLSTPGLALIQLIASEPQETVALAQTLTQQQELISPDILNFIETVLVYKLPHLSREEIKTMLALNDIELKQTRFYQEIAEEERQEGRQEGEVQLLKRLLTKRFGALPAQIIAQLDQANTEQLEKWGEQILDAKSLNELFK